MKKLTKPASLHEALRELWKVQIILKKGTPNHVPPGWRSVSKVSLTTCSTAMYSLLITNKTGLSNW